MNRQAQPQINDDDIRSTADVNLPCARRNAGVQI